MSVSKIAKRYAKSFIDYGSENKKLPALMEDVEGILELAKNKDFKLLLRSPIIKHEVKSQTINVLLEGKIQPETMNFLQLTLQKGRENILPEIMEAIVSKYQALQNITKVVITSAIELSDQELEKISANLNKLKITGDNVAFVKKVDPAIIGGFILEIGDKLYDASVTSKLKVIKTELNQN